jgi:beta-lactamase class C
MKTCINFRKLILLSSLTAVCFISTSFVLPDKVRTKEGVWNTPDNESESFVADMRFADALREKLYCDMEGAACPGMAMAVVKNGKIITIDAFGKDGAGGHINEQTLFRIASLSKGFAGILASKLVNQGIIDLQKPVSYYIPEFQAKVKPGRDSIRVWHILSHTTGYGTHTYSDLISRGVDLEKLTQMLSKLPVRDYPGQTYAYQNATFSLIETIIERTTGYSYADMLDSLIFKPLGMQGASTSLDAILSAKYKALGHKPMKKKGFQPIAFQKQYYNTIAAGGVNASVNDMALWLKAVMGFSPEVITEQDRNLAFIPRANTTDARKYFNNWHNRVASYYGLGWRIVDFPQRRIIFHGGNVNGFRSEIAFDPEKQVGVVFLFNSTCAYSNFAIPEFFQFMENFYHTT